MSRIALARLPKVAGGRPWSEGTFEDEPQTGKLLGRFLPLIDRAAESARFAAETTAELLLQLRAGLVALRDDLAQARDKYWGVPDLERGSFVE